MPLGQFATLDFGQEFPLIWRRGGVPTLTIQADVTQGASPEAVVAALAPAVAKLEASLPKSYHIAVGGTVEESALSQASVYAVVPLMLFITITFLMMQLQSFSRLFLVLSVVPMGLIGVVAALLLFHRPLGFVAILGILALLGMIARNAVILIDQIEAERAEGKAIWDAVVEAAMSRFRPIMLTAISTVLGMIPIAPTIFWGPMALRHHGRAAGCDRPHAHLPACALRHLVSRAGTGSRRAWATSAIFKGQLTLPHDLEGLEAPLGANRARPYLFALPKRGHPDRRSCGVQRYAWKFSGDATMQTSTQDIDVAMLGF